MKDYVRLCSGYVNKTECSQFKLSPQSTQAICENYAIKMGHSEMYIVSEA